MASPQLRRAGRPGARAPGAGQRARLGPRPPRLPVHGHARRRQDDDRAHPRALAQLRARRQLEALRRVRRLPRDRRGPLRGPDRGRRGLPHQGRRHARAARERPVPAEPRPLQGLPDRRSAHAVGAFLQCAPEDARGTAAAREVPARDDRSAEAAGDRAVALPAVQPEAAAGLADRGAPVAHPRRRRRRRSRRRPSSCSRGRRTGACATRFRCSTRCSPSAAGA